MPGLLKKTTSPLCNTAITIIMIIKIISILLSHSQAAAQPDESAAVFDRSAIYYAEDVTSAAQQFISLTLESERSKLIFDFDNQARTRGQDITQTKSFCNVLEWCPHAWGIPVCDMATKQREALHLLMSRVLSPGGYQTMLAIMNRNRVIGEMEDVGDGSVVGDVLNSTPQASGAETVFELEGIEQAPGDDAYPVVGGAKTFLDTGTTVDWRWASPPGLMKRHEQFCDYAIAFFGQPGGDHWSLRFEGHHISINVTFQEGEDGQLEARATPLFFGAFPMVIPNDPFPDSDIAKQWHWVKGQVLMADLVHHLRQFWLHAPDEVRESSKIDASMFSQARPLLLDTPPSSLVVALEPDVDRHAIEAYPHVHVLPEEFKTKALWHLREAFQMYFSAFNSDLGTEYLIRFERAIQGKDRMTLSWAGGALDLFGSHHYSYIVIGDLLLEVLQSNQYTVQHDPQLSGNHIHTMLRDLTFDWDDPMRRHHHNHHHPITQQQ